MKLRLQRMKLTFRKSVEEIEFSPQVTFIHGPVSTGKSTIARLIDFCFAGDIETTPALRQEFVSATLALRVGSSEVEIERAATDASSARVTWTNEVESQTVIAPFTAAEEPIVGQTVFNFSDLVFHLSGCEPIWVRRSKRDPDSPLVRMSFRDLFWYCYLQQDILDSSFFRLEDTFKRNKSIDAMRFVVGLHSDRMNELERDIAETRDKIRVGRDSAEQIRGFLRKFGFGTESDIQVKVTKNEDLLALAIGTRDEIESDQLNRTHALEPMRRDLRELNSRIADEETASEELSDRIGRNQRVLSELVTQKTKSSKKDVASRVLAGVEFENCPQCGSCLLYTSPSPRDKRQSRMPSSA